MGRGAISSPAQSASHARAILVPTLSVRTKLFVVIGTTPFVTGVRPRFSDRHELPVRPTAEVADVRGLSESDCLARTVFGREASEVLARR